MLCQHSISLHSAPCDTSRKPHKGGRIVRAQEMRDGATHHFSFSPGLAGAIKRKRDTRSVWRWRVTLATKEKAGCQTFLRLRPLFLILPVKPRTALAGWSMQWLFQHRKGESCNSCVIISLILLGNTTVITLRHTHTLSFPPSSCSDAYFLQSFLMYPLSQDCLISKTSCNE